jgi:hypothetical protein
VEWERQNVTLLHDSGLVTHFSDEEGRRFHSGMFVRIQILRKAQCVQDFVIRSQDPFHSKNEKRLRYVLMAIRVSAHSVGGGTLHSVRLKHISGNLS